MQPRTQLIRLQRALYQRLKEATNEKTGRHSKSLSAYYAHYEKDFHGAHSLSSRRSLTLDILNSQAVFCGDFHTLPEAQKTLLSLLQETVKLLKRKKKNIVLGLEMLHVEDKGLVNAFLSGRLKEEQFLKKTRIVSRWGFQWENYRPLFLFAKEHQMTLLPLSRGKGGTLKERDLFASSQIFEILKEDSQSIVFVQMGDLHLAADHLPGLLKIRLKRAGLKRQVTVVHQNQDKLYWDLVEGGVDNLVDVVKLKKNVYCVMSAAPWVKLQSQLKWLEAVSEGSDSRVAVANYAKAIDNIDYSHEIEEALSAQKAFFGIDEPLEGEFHLQGPLSLDFLDSAKKNGSFSALEVRLLSLYLTLFEAQYFPRTHDIFLTTLKLDTIATQAAFFLHSELSGFNRVFTKPKEDFYPFVWVEALGFLGSKILNPKSPSISEFYLRRKARYLKSRKAENAIEWEAVSVVLQHLEKERHGNHPIIFTKIKKPAHILKYYLAAKLLGAHLGGAIYTALMERRIDPDEVKALFFCPFGKVHQPKKLYLDWKKRLTHFAY